jgi:tyrosyl-tRNA synthetase
MNDNILSQVQKQIDSIKMGAVELIKEDELYDKLRVSLITGVPLKIKAGFDPTSPDIHLGHTVLLNKLRVFQEYGHQVFFIIGDFTAMIGDPTGKSEARKPLSEEEVLKNSETYKEQAFKILIQEKTKILFNSWWLSDFNLADFIKISSNYTVARMLEKDDFEKRFKDNRPIAIHEFIYPLLQGIDSVFIKCDLELGGNDQKFNLVVGRELMKSSGLPPQVVMTMPLLEGLDGKNKMSKSLGNTIGIFDEPNEMFGKVMSISDEMMIKYYELLSSISVIELNKLKDEIKNGLNPLIAKKRLAQEIVERYCGKDYAAKSLKYFEDKYQKKINPENIETINIDIKTYQVESDKNINYAENFLDDKYQKKINPEIIETISLEKENIRKELNGNIVYSENYFLDTETIYLNIIPILHYIKAVSSNSEAKRLIKQGAIKINLTAEDVEKIKALTKNSKIESAIIIKKELLQLPIFTKEFIIKIGKKKIYKIKLIP